MNAAQVARLLNHEATLTTFTEDGDDDMGMPMLTETSVTVMCYPTFNLSDPRFIVEPSSLTGGQVVFAADATVNDGDRLTLADGRVFYVAQPNPMIDPKHNTVVGLVAKLETTTSQGASNGG